MSNLVSAPYSSSRGRPSRQRLHDRLSFAVEELRSRLGGLPSAEEAEAIWTDIWWQEAHSSTALEGNTLVRREVEILLKEGRAVGNKELKDYLEVRGYADAAHWVYGQSRSRGDWRSGKLVTLTEVRQVHRLALTPVWEVAPHPAALASESPGNWRQHNIHPFGQGMTPPEHPSIPALMTDWVAAVNVPTQAGQPVAEWLAASHAAFERIHPFLDGNGRAGRLLLNLVLVRLGYPPAIIQQRLRPRYLAGLARADAADPGVLGELIARSILDNLNRFVLPALAGPARLVPIESLAGKDISLVALRYAAMRGRLKAVKSAEGRWQSSRQWVDEYRRGRYDSLRQPRKKK